MLLVSNKPDPKPDYKIVFVEDADPDNTRKVVARFNSTIEANDARDKLETLVRKNRVNKVDKFVEYLNKRNKF